LAVVLPGTVDQVRQLMHYANDHRLALVPWGGRTGLSGAAVACRGEIVVSLDRLNRILDFDPTDRSVTCQAGVVTEALQNFARDHGLYYPVDFAARGSSQIGGNIATNAGGIKVIRYGLTRDWVTGLTVVTGRGDLLDLKYQHPQTGESGIGFFRATMRGGERTVVRDPAPPRRQHLRRTRRGLDQKAVLALHPRRDRDRLSPGAQAGLRPQRHPESGQDL
jgi:FAD/FMN-containing dehydrogenase